MREDIKDIFILIIENWIGFIKFFKDGHCTGNCLSCNYCKTIADKVIVKNDEICNYLEQLYDKFNEAKF